MIIIKEKVKDLPTLIFLMIFDFWAGTVWQMSLVIAFDIAVVAQKASSIEDRCVI